MTIIVESLSAEFNKLKLPLKRAAELIFKKLDKKSFSVDIILVNNKVMKKNVLSFSQPIDFLSSGKQGIYLGEVYLNPKYIEKNGEDLNYMLVHGLLHLFSYDHQKKNDIIKMKRKEAETMKLIETHRKT